MSFNGSGTFQINTAGQPVVAGTVITATAFNALTADLATGLSTCITKDGQTTVTANIPMGGNKLTGLAAGTAAADSARLSQVQGGVVSLLGVTGIDTIAASANPVLTSYATGQMFWFVAAGTNTGATTLNIDALGAKNITRGTAALAAGDIINGAIVLVVYDGTQFQLLSITRSIQTSSTIASASTTNIGAANAEYLAVSGTTTITAFDTVTAGIYRVLKFDGILTLTYNATSLILPGGASITTAAGDTAGFVSLGSGNWRCEWYQRFSGSPIGVVAIANGGTGSTTASAARTALAVPGLADANSFTAANRGAITALTDGATITADFAAANNYSLTIGGNRTLANPTNQTAGQSGAIVITQDGTGGRTLAYGANWKFAGGTVPVLTTTAGAVDVLVYYVESASRITAAMLNDVK